MSKQQIWLPGEHSKEFFKHFFIIFLTIALILITAVTVFYAIEIKGDISEIQNKEDIFIDLQEQIVTDFFADIISDLKFLSLQNELIDHLDSTRKDVSHEIAREYLSFCREKQRYDQIRFIDEYGDEIVRVNNNNGSPSIVPEEKL